MPTTKISMVAIKDSYKQQTGDYGAISFLTEELLKHGFNLNKPYKKEVINNFLVCTQE